MPSLLDNVFGYFNSPDAAMAAGLLSPTPRGTFGEGLLQGQAGRRAQAGFDSEQASRAMRQKIAQEELKRVQRDAELRRQRQSMMGVMGTEQAGPVLPGQARPYGGGSGILADRQVDPQEMASLLSLSNDPLKDYSYLQQSAKGNSQYHTTIPMANGTLITNARNGRQQFVPYPSGAGKPVAHDPNIAYGKGYAGTSGTGHAERALEAPSKARSLAAQESQTGLVDDLINEAKENANVFTTGIVGGATQYVWGTPAYNLSNTLEGIRSNIGFDKLRALKDAGGTLGQVSDFENRQLQKTWSSLEQSQTQAQFLKNLDRVQQQYKESWQRITKEFKDKYGEDYQGFVPKDANNSGRNNVPEGKSTIPAGITPQEWDALGEEGRALWK